MQLVSIIIPVYNVEKYIEKCIESCVKQTYENIQIILVDDGSTDCSGIICEQWREQDTRIEVCHKENGGLSSARNAGIERARGEFICFIDGDDYVDVHLIEDCIEAMTDEIDMVSYNYIKVSEDEKILSRSTFVPAIFDLCDEEKRFAFITEKLLSYEYGWEAWSKLYRRDIIVNNHLFFEDNKKIFAEDVFFSCCYLAFARGYRCLYGAYYAYVQRDDSIMSMQNENDNLNRLNELSICLKQFYQNSLSEKSEFVTDFSLIHYLVLNNQINRLKKISGRSKIEILGKINNDINNWNYCEEQLKNLQARKKVIKKYLGKDSKRIIMDELRLLFKENNRRGCYTFLSNRIFKVNCWIDKISIKNVYKLMQIIFSKKVVYVLGTEDFGNIGDHQIARSMNQYIKDRDERYKIIEVPASLYWSRLSKLKKCIKSTDLLIMPGGGNIGNVYKEAECIRESIITEWPNNKKIIFPQSIFYQLNEDGDIQLTKDKNLYNNAQNLTLILRGRYSYQFAKEHFSCELELMPDIVLREKRNTYSKRKNVVLFCMREDIEKNISDTLIQKIKKQIEIENIDYRFCDTQQLFSIPMEKRDAYCDEFLDYFSNVRMVITDRLHGMVFSAITGTPCLAIDNSYKKLEECYQWISECEYVCMLDECTDIYEQVEKMLDISQFTYEYDEKKNSELLAAIKM